VGFRGCSRGIFWLSLLNLITGIITFKDTPILDL
jgi:hypothetical protein